MTLIALKFPTSRYSESQSFEDKMTGGSDAVSLSDLSLREVRLTSEQALVHQTET